MSSWLSATSFSFATHSLVGIIILTTEATIMTNNSNNIRNKKSLHEKRNIFKNEAVSVNHTLDQLENTKTTHLKHEMQSADWEDFTMEEGRNESTVCSWHRCPALCNLQRPASNVEIISLLHCVFHYPLFSVRFPFEDISFCYARDAANKKAFVISIITMIIGKWRLYLPSPQTLKNNNLGCAIPKATYRVNFYGKGRRRGVIFTGT